MISLTDYKWLSKDIVLPETINEEQLTAVLNTLDKDSMPAYRKEALAKYFISKSTEQNKQMKFSNDIASIQKQFRSWGSTNAYQKCLQEVIGNDHTKFMMCGLAIIMAGTICVYFLRAVIANDFLINFSIDAIIVSIAIAFLIVNFKKKYSILKEYSKYGYYACMDAISFILCILLKFTIPAMFDCSVIILFIAYIVEKKRFEKEVKDIY